MRFFVICGCALFVACGESHRSAEGLAPERALSDAGLAEFDAEPIDAEQINPDVTLDSTVDVDTIRLDAMPTLDASIADSALPIDAGLVEDAEPDSRDSDSDVQPLDAEVEDTFFPDVGTPLDASAPDPDEGIELVDAGVEEGLPLNPPLCPNAGVRLESITPSDDFPGLLTVSLDYNNWQGTICFDEECHEGVLDPPDTRYPTALITDRYRVDWSYMIGAGQLESRLWISDFDGSLVVEMTGLRGPAGMMNSPGFYDDHGRHFTGDAKVNHPTAEDTEVEISVGTLFVFHTCRPDRGP